MLIKNEEEEKNKIILKNVLKKLEEGGNTFSLNNLSQNERELYLKHLRNKSRSSYINNIENKKIQIFEQQIKEEEKVFEGISLSKREQKLMNINKKILEIAKKNKLKTVKKPKLYIMPIDDEEEESKKKKVNSIFDRYNHNEKNFVNEEEEWTKKQIGKVYKKDILEKKKEKYNDFVFDPKNKLFSSIEDKIKKEIKPIGDNKKNIKFLTKFEKLQEDRKKLPIYKHKQKILKTIEENSITILVGETGSGKTTQLPQYLNESGYTNNMKKIGITQPRRVAAMSVASRVSVELDCLLGHEVGYNIRFENCTRENTIIKFLTDGMLLKEFLDDPELNDYSVIIIDEAHERTISSDILLSLLKDLTKLRKDLRLIVASATLDAYKFSTFFDNAPVVKVPGRRYDVDIYYTKSPEADYVEATILTVLQIHVTQDEGDILVFLTGKDEIESASDMLIKRSRLFGKRLRQLIVLPLYSNLPPEEQIRVFEKTPKNCRKVVLATNIAETSITIDNIVYVIDCGFSKQNSYNPKSGLESLIISPISKANADQRAGRAGRVKEGKCFRLYTLWSFQNELDNEQIPEIQRTNLGGVILLLKNMGIDNLVQFDFMDAPNHQALIKAIEQLYFLKALDEEGNLTEIGKKMNLYPLEPFYSKMMVMAVNYKCIDQIATICAILNIGGSLFFRPKDKIIHSDTAKLGFEKLGGDHISLLNVYNKWEESNFSSQFCRDFFIQYKSLIKVRNIKEQLLDITKKSGVDINDPELSKIEVNCENIKKCILEGFFMNIAKFFNKNKYKTLKSKDDVFIHPSSFLFKKNIEFICYNEVVLTSEEYMRNILEIDQRWLLEMFPHYYQYKDIYEKSKLENLKKILDK